MLASYYNTGILNPIYSHMSRSFIQICICDFELRFFVYRHTDDENLYFLIVFTGQSSESIE